MATWGTPVIVKSSTPKGGLSCPRADVVVQRIPVARRAPRCCAERWRVLYQRAGVGFGQINNGSERYVSSLEFLTFQKLNAKQVAEDKRNRRPQSAEAFDGFSIFVHHRGRMSNRFFLRITIMSAAGGLPKPRKSQALGGFFPT